MKRLAVMLAAAAMASLAEAVQYYVDNRKGDDINDGMSAERPFRTLAKATAMLKAGDVLDVVSG